jgi:multidrug efflux pump subunit AcrA (membrane-fusion protein)
MKSILSKPLLVTVIAFIVAAAAGFMILPAIGKAPVISPSLASQAASGAAQASASATGTTTASAGSSIQLSFSATGRVATVNVAQGAAVKKGDILATLDASVASAAVSQAKAALDLARAQYASLNLQYANAKTQQDTLVNNAYATLLSSGLEARSIGVIDESHNPTISGTYTCGKEGSYQVDVYGSGADSGYGFNVHGLEGGNGKVTYGAPQALGTCGLYITFVPGFSGADKWTIDIPNTHAPSYQANKNAYDLAVSTRAQTLSQLSASVGQNSAAPDANTAGAAISQAEAAYQSAQAQYANNIITAPADGTVSFVDTTLKVGQSVSANQRVITITAN